MWSLSIGLIFVEKKIKVKKKEFKQNCTKTQTFSKFISFIVAGFFLRNLFLHKGYFICFCITTKHFLAKIKFQEIHFQYYLVEDNCLFDIITNKKTTTIL